LIRIRLWQAAAPERFDLLHAQQNLTRLLQVLKFKDSSEAGPQTLDSYKRQPELAGLFLIGSFNGH
jgi:hypothetical protein